MFLLIVSDYLVWHYSASLRQFFMLWLNFIWFVVHFFSITLLLNSLFTPFKRMTEHANKKSLEAYAEVFVVNLMSRVVGFILRSVIILVGIITLLLCFAASTISLFLWLVAPGLVVGGFFYSLFLIIV